MRHVYHAFEAMQALTLALMIGACATSVPDTAPDGLSGAGSAVDGSATNTRPAQPARRLDGTFPQIQFSGRVPGSTERAQRFLVISVEITETGLADLKTLRISGPGAVENRAEIERWLHVGRYEPARDGAGRPIRSRHRIELRVGS